MTDHVNAADQARVYLDDDLLLRLADEYQTPLYVFDEAEIRRNCRLLKSAIHYPNTQVRYACKALTLQAVLKIVREEGLWIDASSLNEVHRAHMAGFDHAEIYYTGEGGDLDVYQELVRNGVLINCTSIDSIHLLAKAGGTEASIRINPGEGHGSNKKINTGGPSSKHGIYYDQVDEARALCAQYGIKIIGVHSHIGSGTDIREWMRIKEQTLDYARAFEDVEIINLGGGLPVIYNSETDDPMPIHEWGDDLAHSMRHFSEEMGREIKLQIEPGRFVVASAGVLLGQVRAVKSTRVDDEGHGYNFVIVNTGLNHNIRPSMYGAFHPIRFLPDRSTQGAQTEYVIAGYICESGDVFTVDETGTLRPRPFAPLAVDDMMIMGGVGAYCHSMKSAYNSMNLPASVLVHEDGSHRLIERRSTLEDLMRREVG